MAINKFSSSPAEFIQPQETTSEEFIDAMELEIASEAKKQLGAYDIPDRDLNEIIYYLQVTIMSDIRKSNREMMQFERSYIAKQVNLEASAMNNKTSIALKVATGIAHLVSAGLLGASIVVATEGLKTASTLASTVGMGLSPITSIADNGAQANMIRFRALKEVSQGILNDENQDASAAHERVRRFLEQASAQNERESRAFTQILTGQS